MNYKKWLSVTHNLRGAVCAASLGYFISSPQ